MSLGIDAIDDLGLESAFPGGDGFSCFLSCWSCSKNSQILVVDDNSRCLFSSEIEQDRERGFLLINAKNNLIVLLAIDNCLIDNHPGGIADCAVFDSRQFLFVEFKSNALGNSDNAVQDTFDKAVSQLIETINVFRMRVPALFSLRRMKCFIITSHSFPRATATKLSYTLSFMIDSGIELSFNTRYVF